MSRLLLDTSVVVKLLFPEEHSDLAAALLDDARHADWGIFAPQSLPVEESNVIRRRMRRDRLDLADAITSLDDFLAPPVTLVGSPALYRRALRLTERYSLSAFDAQFVALAQILDCDLWTADEALLRAVSGRLSFMRWIGDYNGQVR